MAWTPSRWLRGALSFDPQLPPLFYLLLSGRFVNMIGNSLVFPFLSVFLASRFHDSMTQVGLVLSAYGFAQVLSVLVGGVLADSWGRRRVMLLSLGGGAMAAYAVGIVGPLVWLLPLLMTMGFLMPLFQPASLALVADIVPESRLGHAFGLMRMASNAGIIIGPMLGGLLANYSYYWLFALDAGTLLAFFVLVVYKIPETRPEGLAHGNVRDTLGGLVTVSRDGGFVVFAVLWSLTWMVYSQLYIVLPAYLHLRLGFPPGEFGYLAAENAVLVVTLQMPVTRLVAHLKAHRAMALGLACYGLGFLTMLLAHALVVFGVAVLFITVGENIVNPTSSAWVASRAPEHLRGRYMGFFSLFSRIGSAFGPLMGGALLASGRYPWLLVTASLALFTAVVYERTGRKPEANPPSLSGAM